MLTWRVGYAATVMDTVVYVKGTLGNDCVAGGFWADDFISIGAAQAILARREVALSWMKLLRAFAAPSRCCIYYIDYSSNFGEVT